jgi:predicted short-subunit dehydrogenase-like oxidoreductase (DUF2520 family)
MKPSIALIGPGKVGCAVTQRLHDNGYPVQTVIGREIERTIEACRFIGCPEHKASIHLSSLAGVRIILLAVPDDQLAILASELREQQGFSTEQVLVHFSGLHPAAILLPPKSNNLALSIHPLLPFANRQLASEKLTACPCALEGDEAAIDLGEELINAFGGQPFRIDSDHKALYHASACIASNFLVSLLATAAELLSECGVMTESSVQMLLPLVQASLDNVEQLGPQQGLTGPIVRGDIGTVTAHIAALKSSRPELLPFYQLLGTKTVELAESSARLPEEQAKKIKQLINSFDSDQF